MDEIGDLARLPVRGSSPYQSLPLGICRSGSVERRRVRRRARSSSRGDSAVGRRLRGGRPTRAVGNSDETLQARALTVNVAILEVASLRIATDGAVTLPSDSVETLTGVCPSERFAGQPAAALCSGVLRGPSLVLTATHCLRDVPCESMAVVRGFAYDAPDELRPLRTTDVKRCKRVLHSTPTRRAGARVLASESDLIAAFSPSIRTRTLGRTHRQCGYQ